MASMAVTFEVSTLEEDADRHGLAEQLIDALQAQYKYIDIELVEVNLE